MRGLVSYVVRHTRAHAYTHTGTHAHAHTPAPVKCTHACVVTVTLRAPPLPCFELLSVELATGVSFVSPGTRQLGRLRMKLEPQDLSRRTEDFRAPAPEGEAPASAASLRSGAPHMRLPTPHPQASSSQRGEGSTEHQAGPRPRRRAAGSPGPGEPGTRQQRGPRGVRPSGFAGGVLNTLSAVLSHAEGELGGV